MKATYEKSRIRIRSWVYQIFTDPQHWINIFIYLSVDCDCKRGLQRQFPGDHDEGKWKVIFHNFWLILEKILSVTDSLMGTTDENLLKIDWRMENNWNFLAVMSVL